MLPPCWVACLFGCCTPNWERRHAAMPRCRTCRPCHAAPCWPPAPEALAATPTHHAPTLTRRGHHKLGRGYSAAHPCDAEGPGREEGQKCSQGGTQGEAGRAAARQDGCSSAATAAWLGLEHLSRLHMQLTAAVGRLSSRHAALARWVADSWRLERLGGAASWPAGPHITGGA